MATLVKSTSATCPEIITVRCNNDDYSYVAININICKTTNGIYEYVEIVLPEFALNNIHNADLETKYSVLVAHIIKAYYNDNQALAVLGNYLLDQENDKYKTEFDTYQKVRQIAKDTAKEIIRNNMF